MTTGLCSFSTPRPASAGADCFARTLVIDDFDRIAECYPGHECHFMQLGRGAFRAELDLVLVPGVRCLRGRLNRSLWGIRMPFSPRYTFSPIDESNAGWRVQGRRFRPGLVHYTPGSTPRDDVTTPDSSCSGVSVDEPVLRDAVAVLLRKDLEDLLPASGMSLSPSPQSYRGFSGGLTQAIDSATADPFQVTHPELAEEYRVRMLNLVCDLLEGSDLAPEQSELKGIRAMVIKESIDYMRANYARSLTSLDLCRELCVSRRTLFYAFHEAYGFGPMTYLKRLRMNHVRAELKVHDPTSSTVREISSRMGFHHAGQFAADYTRLFGERPYVTLARVR